jgi:hypothetical protein
LIVTSDKDGKDSKLDQELHLIVQGGKLAGVGAHSYSAGNATGGSEEAAKFIRLNRVPLGLSAWRHFTVGPQWVVCCG